MRYTLDLRNVTSKVIYPLGEKFLGRRAEGEEIAFTNYYMTVNGKPFFGVTGEMHFSRIPADRWEDAIIKAKMGGINIIATYVFWNVHEEVEGQFRFDGCRNLRRFVELSQKHGLYVILRIGPFGHGEMRNGGLPDWLYGKPYESRNCNEGFYGAVRKYFSAINSQVDGLYYRQGGPIIAAQLDNEYMHSAAAWESTTGISNEWVPSGSGGNQYMLDLKRIMQEVGIVTPFYTSTAWGGAMVPTDDALPLWGGYAYWPWIFYEKRDDGHPATPEYIYRDNHNNAVPKTYNFEPRYEPESRPYACCEMMGGMTNCYYYRFQLPFESVDALANIKLGSGCNLLGYYMYHGGTNPRGEQTPFLNEAQVPKLSYDYQAAIGEYGQLRPSYYRLKVLHYFCQTFFQPLCQTKVVLPEGADDLEPNNTEHLRYSVRVCGNSGFVFLDNFQDHLELPPREDESILLQLPEGDLLLEGLSLAGGENAILPFNQDLDGALLRYSTAQPITRLAEEKVWFFFAPDGMTPVYCFDAGSVRSAEGCSCEWVNGFLRCRPETGKTSSFQVEGENGAVTIVTLTRADSLRFTKLELPSGEAAILSDGGLLWDGTRLKAETTEKALTICAYPPKALEGLLPDDQVADMKPASIDLFHGVKLTLKPELTAKTELTPVQVGPSRYTLSIPGEALRGHKSVLLRMNYMGDIGHAFIDGEMISDNFSNGAVWDVRVDHYGHHPVPAEHRQHFQGQLRHVLQPGRQQRPAVQLHGRDRYPCLPRPNRQQRLRYVVRHRLHAVRHVLRHGGHRQ